MSSRGWVSWAVRFSEKRCKQAQMSGEAWTGSYPRSGPFRKSAERVLDARRVEPLRGQPPRRFRLGAAPTDEGEGPLALRVERGEGGLDVLLRHALALEIEADGGIAVAAVGE